MLTASREIGRRFAAASTRYDDSAVLQKQVARALAARIARALVSPPARILEIGCGTGLLTRALREMFPDALIVATDLAPEMLRACASSMPDDPNLLLLATDGQVPATDAPFDLVCSSLAMQWFASPVASCRVLAGLVAPGGALHLATLLDGSLSAWDAANRTEAVMGRTPPYPTVERLCEQTGFGWQAETVVVPYKDGLSFLRALRAVGADLGRIDRRPHGAGTLRRVVRRFERQGAVADYRVGYGAWTRSTRSGVFVTGTDTGIGKTLVSACLVAAWGAEYWKPMQTGLAEDPGDTETVRVLTGCDERRLHPPAIEMQAPLSPEDAAEREGRRFDPSGLALPPGRRMLVVEGAGGVLVPLDGQTLTTALIGQLGLPVVLVARSTLGTINHTLLSLEALRRRGIAVLGVVLNGPPSPGNRSAIERHGRVRVLAELPWLDAPGQDAVARFAELFAACRPDQ